MQTNIQVLDTNTIMQALMNRLPKAFNLPKEGDTAEGKVIKKSARNLFVDLGAWGIGIVYGIEFTNAQSIIKNLKLGDVVLVKILEVENEAGLRELSLTEAQSQKSWDLIREYKKTNHVIAAKILKVNRGGLLVEIAGIAGFLPVAQLKGEHYPRVEAGDKEKILEELSKFVGQEFNVRILDFDPKEDKLIVSEKAAEEEHLKQVIGRHQVGDVIAGTISGIVDWGAFIKWPAFVGLSADTKALVDKSAGKPADEETLEGLIHISELDWQLIENPADFVKVGDQVKAQIIDISNDRVSLSMKRLKKDPWKTASAFLEKGMLVEGAVKKFNPFGAFVEIAWGDNVEFLQGLCHISEFGSDEKMRHTCEVGKKYQFKVLTFVPEEHRMSLGLFKEGEELAESKTA